MLVTCDRGQGVATEGYLAWDSPDSAREACGRRGHRPGLEILDDLGFADQGRDA
jgi:hypothetical protein